MRVTVGTSDLRAALKAVSPHAYAADSNSIVHRVRIDIGPVNVSVSATNRITAAHAIVSTIDGDDRAKNDGEHGHFDISPTDAKSILALFKSGKPGRDDDWGDMLRIDVTGEHCTITDVAGLFPGQSLSLLRYPVAKDYPDIPGLIGGALNQAKRKPPERLVVGGHFVKLFAAATTAYGERLVIEPTGASSLMVMHVGESFIGLLVPSRPDENDERDLTDWRQGWLRRLPGASQWTVQRLWDMDPLPPAEPPDEEVDGQQGIDPDALEPDPLEQAATEAATTRESHAEQAVDALAAGAREVPAAVFEPAAADAPPLGADELLDAAVELVIGTQFGSATMLHRKLRCGHDGAHALLEQMEARGIVGKANGRKAREVLIPAERLQDVLTQIRDGRSG